MTEQEIGYIFWQYLEAAAKRRDFDLQDIPDELLGEAMYRFVCTCDKICDETQA